MNFINNGTDERILKSMGTENPSEELIKAMNTQGLVQREVQVKGKNGQTFTRKQWVKASDTKVNSDTKGVSAGKETDKKGKASSGHPVDISKFSFKDYRNPDGQHMSGRETYRSTLQEVAKETEKAVTKTISSYNGSMPPYKTLSIEFSNINGHSTYRDMISPSSEQGLKDARSAIFARQRELLESVKDYTKWDSSQRKWVKASEDTKVTQKKDESPKPKSGDSPKLTDKTVKTSPSDLKVGDYIKYVGSGETKGEESVIQIKEITKSTVKGVTIYHINRSSKYRTACRSDKTVDKYIPTKDIDFSKVSDTELKNMSELNMMNMSDAGNRHDTKAYEYFVDRQAEINMELGKRQKNSKDSTPKFDKTKSGKVGGIQIGKELATVVKIASGKKLREVTDPDTGKVYEIYTDTSSNKPDGIVAIEKESKKNGTQPQKSNAIQDALLGNNGKDGKKLLMDLLGKGHSKKDIMEEAEKAGVTWKSNDHEGINWMRASMAIQKYISK